MADPFIELAETVGRALLKYAADTRSSPPSSSQTRGFDPLKLTLGSRQQRIVEIVTANKAMTLTTREIADAMDTTDTPNVHVGLRALEDRGVVEMVPNSSPIRWTLAPRYR